VPFGSTAEIVIPKLGLNNVMLCESGKAIWQDAKSAGSAEGVTSVKEEDGEIVVQSGSGRYVFELKGN
jgi:prophage tail gpP-like protein